MASDPAVAAAHRAQIDSDPLGAIHIGIAAAREALTPIRVLHKAQMDTCSALHPEPACSCGNGADWRDCPTARLIYSDEELS